MILEDFVMLGKTTPETDRQGRTTVCSAGWSPELKQLVRVYPLAVEKQPQDFSVSRIHLERNHKDTRMESWKIAGDRGAKVHRNINSRFEFQRMINDWDGLLETIPIVESMTEANAKRLSLALIQPDEAPKYYFDINHDWRDNKDKICSKSYKWTPRLKFMLGGNQHKLKYLNQEAYEGMTRIGRGYFRSISNKFKNNPLLLVGNMFAYRKNWLVISAFNRSIND